MENIQIQVDFRGVKRVFLTPAPESYSQLLSLLTNHVEKIKLESCCLLYENDEGDYVLLPKDKTSLTVAIQSSRRIPGVEIIRLKIQVLESTSPLSTQKTKGKSKDAHVKDLTDSFSKGMKELSPCMKSPCSKRGKFSSSDTLWSSTECKKQLSFSRDCASEKNDRINRTNLAIPCGDEFDNDDIYGIGYEEYEENITPLTRYIKKTENEIKAEEKSLSILNEQLESINKRLEKVKNYPSHGNLCRKCHLRLGHTARGCTYGKCSSVFSCGQEKFHAGELNTKELENNIRRKEKQIQNLKGELRNKKAACNSVSQSFSRRIEADLFDENKEDYMMYGIKNWTLLRKHVHAVEQYCKQEYNGKLPAKKDVKLVLRKALENTNAQLNPSAIRSRQRHGNPSKSALESHGVEFPSSFNRSSSRLSVSSSYSNDPCANALPKFCDMYIPKSKEEEDAQIKTALIESKYIAGKLCDERNEFQNSPPTAENAPSIIVTTTSEAAVVSNVVSREVSLPSPQVGEDDDNDKNVANILLSLMK